MAGQHRGRILPKVVGFAPADDFREGNHLTAPH
jgi:hypothetical protein